MATIAKTSMNGSGDRAITETTMTSADTFVFDQGENAVLYVRNSSGGNLTINIDGADGTTVPVSGVGDVSVASGFSFTVNNNTTRAIPLNSIRAYLQGTIAVTGGTAAVASILTF